MHYEINISLNGKHFFATSERSITSDYKLREVYDALKNKFNENDGYSFDVIKYQTVGTVIDINEIYQKVGTVIDINDITK